MTRGLLSFFFGFLGVRHRLGGGHTHDLVEGPTVDLVGGSGRPPRITTKRRIVERSKGINGGGALSSSS